MRLASIAPSSSVMASQKPTSTEIVKAAETIGAIAVCVGAAILFVTSPEARKKLAEGLGKPSEKTDTKPPIPRTNTGTPVTGGDGVVYLLKAGPFFKIGKAQGFDKRYRQIKLHLPFPTEAIHQIECSDISHVERYWHKRFAPKRQNGEWFVLTDEEVAEFKSHAKM